MEFVGFDEPVRLTGRGGEPVTIETGLYRVEVADEGEVVLTGHDGTATRVQTAPGGHPLALEEPLAVTVAGKGRERQLAVLLPGGRALIAGSAAAAPGEAPPRVAPAPLAEAILLKYHLPGTPLLQRSDFWRSFHKYLFGTIEPGTAPTGFGPQTFPPNWVGTTVVTCYVPPAGSYGPGGPGTASGVPPFPPGTMVRRGPFPGYLVSTTPVRVTCPGGAAGQVVELRVTAHVATVGIPTILSMTWEDVYRIVPAAGGPVDFPGVIVATGRVPTSPPPPGTTWAAKVQAQRSSSTGFGVPIVLDLYVAGHWVASRQMGYYASYPGGPPPVIADK